MSKVPWSQMSGGMGGGLQLFFPVPVGYQRVLTISGRRQPPAMPQGAPVEGAPMGRHHHS